MDVVTYIGLSQSLFAAILLLSKKEAGDSEKLLATWLIFLAIEFLSCALDLYLFSNSLLSSVFLLINPAFFLYIKSLTTKDFSFKYIQLFHLAPYLFFETMTYFIQEPFHANFLNPEYPYFWFSILFSIANIISWIFYNFWSVLLVSRHQRNLRDEFSNIESYKKIVWLLFVLIFYIIYCGVTLTFGILALRMDGFQDLPALFTYSVMLFLTYVLGFYGLKQKRIYHVQKEIQLIDELPEKYKSSTLSLKDKTRISKNILEYFNKQQPYLNSDFNMTMMSNDLRIPKHYLTEVLNMEMGINFFSFVNTYRIEAVKKMLLDKSNNYSIEAIGYECGFNSKSSFFTVFKSATGFTPTQFRISKSS